MGLNIKQYMFSTGTLVATPTSGVDPAPFGTLQDVSIDFSGDIKMLYGGFGFPVSVARGKQKIEIKAGNGEIDVGFYNATFFNQAAGVSVGSKRSVVGEAGVIPTTPYQITAANGATYYLNQGVWDVLTGKRMQQVASGPVTGQYSLNSTTGVYTFAAADTGKAVVYNYLYTDASNGQTLNLANQLMGVAPTFELVLADTFDGKTMVVQFNKVTASKLQMPLKLDDYMITDLDMSAQTDASNNLGFISLTG